MTKWLLSNSWYLLNPQLQQSFTYFSKRIKSVHWYTGHTGYILDIYWSHRVIVGSWGLEKVFNADIQYLAYPIPNNKLVSFLVHYQGSYSRFSAQCCVHYSNGAVNTLQSTVCWKCCKYWSLAKFITGRVGVRNLCQTRTRQGFTLFLLLGMAITAFNSFQIVFHFSFNQHFLIL